MYTACGKKIHDQNAALGCCKQAFTSSHVCASLSLAALFFFFFFLRGTLAAFLIACDQSLACPEKRIDDDDSRMNSPVVARYPSCHHKISTPFLNLLHMCVCAREREVAVAILRIHALLLSLEVDSMRFWLIWGPTAASGKLACPPRIRPLLVSTTV